MVFVPFSPILNESTGQEYYSSMTLGLGDIFHRDIQISNLPFPTKNKTQPKREKKNERKKAQIHIIKRVAAHLR